MKTERLTRKQLRRFIENVVRDHRMHRLSEALAVSQQFDRIVSRVEDALSEEGIYVDDVKPYESENSYGVLSGDISDEAVQLDISATNADWTLPDVRRALVSIGFVDEGARDRVLMFDPSSGVTLAGSYWMRFASGTPEKMLTLIIAADDRHTAKQPPHGIGGVAT